MQGISDTVRCKRRAIPVGQGRARRRQCPVQFVMGEAGEHLRFDVLVAMWPVALHAVELADASNAPTFEDT
eukprot:1332081-Pyramimonas_sp.AAC.1